jgi:phosphatidylglycerophosphate synthase
MQWRWVPWGLILVRALAGPATLGLSFAFGADSRWICVALVAIGVLSDIFDGVIARRLGVVTDGLRLWDSRVDVVFWLCVAAALLAMRPSLWASIWPIIAVLGAMEATTHVISFARFGREASPHHLLSKLFTLALWALISILLVNGDAPWTQSAVFAMGVASQLEAMAIMLLLPHWRTDVANWRVAWRLRKSAAMS